MRLGETLNEYGTPVVKYRCETCSEVFSVCPAPEPENDDQWTGCLTPECESYDPDRDVDKWFDEGLVRSIPIGDGKSRLVPLRVIEGGRAGCINHPDRPIRENLDGDDLCQECCDQWVKGEQK